MNNFIAITVKKSKQELWEGVEEWTFPALPDMWDTSNLFHTQHCIYIKLQIIMTFLCLLSLNISHVAYNDVSQVLLKCKQENLNLLTLLLCIVISFSDSTAIDISLVLVLIILETGHRFTCLNYITTLCACCHSITS